MNRRGWMAGVALMAVAGCGGRPGCVPVRGELRFRGREPMAGARIEFHALKPDDRVRERPRAEAADDGSFVLTTYLPEDGAPPGEYAVTVVWPKPVRESKPLFGSDRPAVGADRLNGKYADPAKTPLRATIPSPGPLRFELSD